MLHHRKKWETFDKFPILVRVIHYIPVKFVDKRPEKWQNELGETKFVIDFQEGLFLLAIPMDLKTWDDRKRPNHRKKGEIFNMFPTLVRIIHSIPVNAVNKNAFGMAN